MVKKIYYEYLWEKDKFRLNFLGTYNMTLNSFWFMWLKTNLETFLATLIAYVQWNSMRIQEIPRDLKTSVLDRR